MSLISLLIALAAERYLSSSAWQFNTFYQRYIKAIKHTKLLAGYRHSTTLSYGVIFIPVLGCYFLLSQIDNAFLHLMVSTLILIVCFGCIKTRDAYKSYLLSAFKGELTSCELHHWLPVRLVALGYMFVGHFSKAMPVWLENLFEFEKAPSEVLIAVAQMSEDYMVDADDCTAEPCLLVKLAKRTLLLFLTLISALILTGVLS